MRGPPEMCEPSVNNQTNQRSSALNKPIDFSEYMWMGEEEIDDFDKKCEAEFWEDYMMQEAFEQMLAEEEERETKYYVQPTAVNVPPHVENGFGEPQFPPQPQRLTDLESHMASIQLEYQGSRMPQSGAHYQGNNYSYSNSHRRGHNQRHRPRHMHPSAPVNPAANYNNLSQQPNWTAPSSHHHPAPTQNPSLSAQGRFNLNPDAPVFVPGARFSNNPPAYPQGH